MLKARLWSSTASDSDRSCSSRNVAAPLTRESSVRKIPALSSMVCCMPVRRSAIDSRPSRAVPAARSSRRRSSSRACAASDGPGVGRPRGIPGGGAAGARTEDQALGQRVGAQPVGAVDADAGDLARGVQARQRRRAVDVGVDPAHHVVHDRAHRHELADRVDVLVLEAQLAHEGQLGVDQLLAEVPQVEVDDGAVRRVDGAALLAPRARTPARGGRAGRAPCCAAPARGSGVPRS